MKVEWSSGVVEWSSREVPKVPMLHFWGAFLFQFGHHFYKKRGVYVKDVYVVHTVLVLGK